MQNVLLHKNGYNFVILTEFFQKQYFEQMRMHCTRYSGIWGSGRPVEYGWL